MLINWNYEKEETGFYKDEKGTICANQDTFAGTVYSVSDGFNYWSFTTLKEALEALKPLENGVVQKEDWNGKGTCCGTFLTEKGVGPWKE